MLILIYLFYDQFGENTVVCLVFQTRCSRRKMLVYVLNKTHISGT